MALNEALSILNIEQSAATPELLKTTYDKMFKLNDPKNGGSFYLQSKIYRANEAAVAELGFDDDDDDEEEEEEGGEEGKEEGDEVGTDKEEKDKGKG